VASRGRSRGRGRGKRLFKITKNRTVEGWEGSWVRYWQGPKTKKSSPPETTRKREKGKPTLSAKVKNLGAVYRTEKKK